MGSFPYVPKTKDAIESFNGNMKQYQLFDQKKPVKQFLLIALQVVKQRSKAYKKHKVAFQTELQISDEMMRKGCDYSVEAVYRIDAETEADTWYLFASNVEHNEEISGDDVNDFNQKVYSSWDEYTQGYSRIW